VPYIRRSPSGHRPADSLSAVPGSRSRDTENQLEGPPEGRLTPPQGGEPERRGNGPRCAAAERGSPQRAWRSQAPLKTKRHTGDRNATGETTGTAPGGPTSPIRHFMAPRGARITYLAEHVTSRTGGRNGDVRLQGHEGRVPGIRRSRIGRTRCDPLSAVPGSRTRYPENPLEARPGESPHATAGRRAGAEARQAPNATAGRCNGESVPRALLPNKAPPRALRRNSSSGRDSDIKQPGKQPGPRFGHGNRARSSVTALGPRP
jgi:hypothetical protein